MIVKEQINGLTRTYSDSNLMIQKVGTEEIYTDAYDVLEFEYIETEIEISHNLDSNNEN